MKRALVAFATLSLLGCTHEEGIAPNAAPPPRDVPAYDFHSAPWVNLHLVLYGEALKQTGHLSGGGGGGNALELLEGIDKTPLSDPDQQAWNAAISFYASAFAERSPTFDDGLIDLMTKLTAVEDAPDLSKAGLSPPIFDALTHGMTVYRPRFWSTDDQTNRAWMSAMRLMVDRFGPTLRAELAHAYDSKWPDAPIRVDVVRFGTWGGAYSTFDPNHIVISAADPRNGGPEGLESLLHESSHLMIRPLRDALSKELAAQQKKGDTLWHALLFFTAGYVVKERFPGYEPYAYHYGLYKNEWSRYAAALEAHWAPFLHGQATLKVAIHDLVLAL